LRNEKDEAVGLVLFTPSLGGVRGILSALDALLKPVQHFLLDPAHPALAEFDPFGESPGRFKTGHMLRTVENQLLELTL
jgi:hypothetical protein